MFWGNDIVKDYGGLYSPTRKSSFGLSVAEVQAVVDELTEEHKAIKNVVVVVETNDLPIKQSIKDEIAAQKSEAKKVRDIYAANPTYENLSKVFSKRINDIEGAYINGKVYLNTSALSTIQRIKKVFAHEAIGHLSVENMLDEVDVKLMPKLINQVNMLDKSGNKYILELAKRVDASQPGLNKSSRAKEIIAQIAERACHDKKAEITTNIIGQKVIDIFTKLEFDIKLKGQEMRDIVSIANLYSKGEDVTRSYLNARP